MQVPEWRPIIIINFSDDNKKWNSHNVNAYLKYSCEHTFVTVFMHAM